MVTFFGTNNFYSNQKTQYNHGSIRICKSQHADADAGKPDLRNRELVPAQRLAYRQVDERVSFGHRGMGETLPGQARAQDETRRRAGMRGNIPARTQYADDNVYPELLRAEGDTHIYDKGQLRALGHINSKIIAFAFALASEIERNLISQRTREALAAKKMAGMKLGRPPGTSVKVSRLLSDLPSVRRRLLEGESLVRIAKAYGIHRNTLSHYLKDPGENIC